VIPIILLLWLSLWRYDGVYECTAYDPGACCCGIYADGVTATGRDTSVHPYGVAVDPSAIPLGSFLLIEGVGILEADDVGGAIKGRKIDIRMKTHKEALVFGRKNVHVWRRRK